MGRTTLFIIVFILIVVPAIATTTTVVDPRTGVNIGGVWATFIPYVIEAIGVVITACIVWISTMIKARTGIEIEAKYRESLHSAAMTGIQLAAAKIGGKLDGINASTKIKVVDEAANWVLKSVPDAVKHFKLDTPEFKDKLFGLVNAKLGAVQSSANVAVTTGAAPGTA